MADEGKAVIVGRGAAYYLHDRPCTLHVFIYAPFEEKVLRLQSEGKSQDDVAKVQHKLEAARVKLAQQGR